MTTFANSLKSEIARVARKELRDEIASLRKAATAQRAAIASLKKDVKALQGHLRQLDRTMSQAAKQSPTHSSPAEQGKAAARGKPGRKVTFTADRLKSNRQRLGFTQQQMAKLLGVSSLSIWKWESGAAAPRESRAPQILERIALGKRAALAAISE